jgi:predicted nuclease of predicted toxin-antitoxin system
MRFLVDAQLPPSLAELLREHGQEAAHVFDVLPPNARDPVIWPFALQGGCVLVTKDEDFAEWSRLRQPAPPVVWLRIGNVKKGALRAKLEPLLPDLLRRLEAGETLIEVF